VTIRSPAAPGRASGLHDEDGFVSGARHDVFPPRFDPEIITSVIRVRDR